MSRALAWLLERLAAGIEKRTAKIRAAQDARLPFDLRVSSLCAPDRIYVIDPSRAGFAGFPAGMLDEILEPSEPGRKIVVAGSERTADRIRRDWRSMNLEPA